MGTYQGVVLQATYRVQQGVPVVYIFGRLQDGRTFVVRDHNQKPHFYVAQQDAKHVLRAQVTFTDFVSFEGIPLARVDAQVPADVPGIRDGLHQLGLKTYEADVRFAMRYLIDRGIKGSIAIQGEALPGTGTDLAFDNPATMPGTARVTPRVLSFDIETDPQTDRLLAIACYGQDRENKLVDEVVIVDPAGRTMPEHAVGVVNERQALLHFQKLVERLDPDVLTGWNVIDFDLTQLLRFATRARLDLQLGREKGRVNIRPAQGYFGSGHVSIPGRVVLDGVDLLRGAFLKLDSYSLESAALTYLGEGKVFTGGPQQSVQDVDVANPRHQQDGQGRDKVEEILHTYRQELGRFALYARTDARLVVDILDKLDLIDLAFARSRLTGMPPDRVAASIASFDFLYLNELVQRQIAAPSLIAGARGAGPQSGGAVFEPKVGIHENVWVLDFKSLYPSIIRTYNIDPLGYVAGLTDDDPIETVSGARFSRSPSILKQMLDRLVPERAEAKARGDEVASQAIKILMNSCYGVLGTPACRFYNPELANAITGQGRYFLQWSKDWFEDRGYTVLYGDTDSVFVSSAIADATQAMETGENLVKEFNETLARHISETARADSHLELEFEKLYSKLFLAKVRGGNQGARKRYAGLKVGATEPEFVGMEVVRRDWTDLAKEIQRGLFGRLFADNTDGEELAGYVSDVVQKLRLGELDRQLVYRRGLRKPVEDYVTNVPPHVQAVKKSANPPPRIVRYVMTVGGPELVDEARSPIDREYYVERQIRPIAEPVLEIFGLSFDSAIGDDKQTDLFG